MSSCECNKPIIIIQGASGGISTLYSANSTIIGDRTVNANNNDLTFNMGSGIFTINGLLNVSGVDLLTLSSNPGDSNTLWASGNNLYIGDQNLSLKVSADAGNLVTFGSDSGIFLDGDLVCGSLMNCTLSQLGDVTSAVASSGNLLFFNGSAWTPQSVSINSLSDVNFVSAPTTGQTLIWSPVYSAFIPSNTLTSLSISGGGGTQTIGYGETLKFSGAGDLSVSVAADTVTYTFSETTTSLSFNSGTNILTFTDENGSNTNIGLNHLEFVCTDLNACNLDALGNVSVSGATNGQVLTFNGSTWVAQNSAAFSCSSLSTCALDSMADVNYVSTPANGQILRWSSVYNAFIPSNAPFTNFTISDGVNSQTIADGNTLTFSTSGNMVAVVQSTDTVRLGYNEVLTTLAFNSGTNILTYTDERGNVNNLNLTSAASFSCSSLNSCTADKLGDVLYLSSPTNGQVLTWSVIYGSWIPATPFTYFSISGGGSKQNIYQTDTVNFYGGGRTIVGVSGTHNISVRHYDTVTTLSYNSGTQTLSYVDESGTTTNLNIFNCAYLNSCSIDAFSDVSTSGATTGQVLAYNGSSWTPTTVTISGGGSFSCTSLSGCNASSLKDITYPSAPSNGNVLAWSNVYSSWIPSSVFTSFDVSDGTTTQTIVNGNTLSFSGVSGVSVTVQATDRVVIGMNETTTTLTYNSGLNRLTYTDEDGVATNISLVSFTGGPAFVCSSLNLCSIDALSDVALASPTDGQFLVWSSDYNAFVNASNPTFFTISDGSNTQQIVHGNTLTFSGAGAVDVLVSATDRVTISYTETVTSLGSVSGQYLRYTDENGGITNVDVCGLLGNCSIDRLVDVNTSGAVSGYILTYNGSIWTPQAAPGGGGFTCTDLNSCSITALQDVSGTPSNGQALIWDNALSVYKPSGVISAFTITDGFNPQSITNGNTIVFAAGGDLSVATSATDTVTYSFSETVTTMGYNAGTRVLSYTNEDGTVVNVTLPSQFTCTDLNSCSIDALSDVNTAGAVSGQFLKWNGSNWVPANGGGGISADAGNDLTLGGDGLPYIAETITSLTASGTNYLKYVNEAGAENTINICTMLNGCSIDALSDVTVSTPSSNQILRWNGSAWVNSNENVAGSYTFTISDGSTTQTINSGNTLTFADSSCINATVSATDTVTFTPTLAPPVTLLDISGNPYTFANALQCTSSGLYVPCFEIIEPTETGTGAEQLTIRVACGSTWQEYSIPWFDDVKRVGEDALAVSHGDPADHGADLLIDANTGELFYHNADTTWHKLPGTYGYAETTGFTAGSPKNIMHNLDTEYVIVQMYLSNILKYDCTIEILSSDTIRIITPSTGTYKVCILPVTNLV